jgi:hypothetical protein
MPAGFTVQPGKKAAGVRVIAPLVPAVKNKTHAFLCGGEVFACPVIYAKQTPFG